MLRRLAIASFAVAAVLVTACGHQVTPSPSLANNDLSGHIVLKFDVNGTLDFNNYTYAVVIDTCGNGEPYPQAFQSGSLFAFSYGFFIGGSYGTALPQLVEYFVNPNSSGQITSINVPENQSLEQIQLNDNGQNNEFELIFDRAELDNPLGQTQPCPNITAAPTSAPTPTGSAGASPTATPTATATPSGTMSPVASPTATPAPNATTAAQQTWYFNFFTIQNRTILDSLGIGGATDTTFSGGAVDTTITQDTPIFKATGGTEPSNPAAQLRGGDIQNYQ